MPETEVTADSGGVSLAGTLTRPEGAARGVVIFVHGSGPNDRNENSRGGKLNVFNTLAAACAEAGWASIRFDKRGVGASGGSYKRHGYDDLMADLTAWIAYASREGLGPVVLCGHSEGTILAAKASSAPGVAGIALFCPFVTPGEEILHMQAGEAARMVAEMPGFGGKVARLATRLIGSPEKQQAKLLARVRESTAPVIRVGLTRQGVRWLRDFLSWDFAAIHRAVAVPTLLLVAGKDVQCPPSDGPAIAALNPLAALKILPDLTHLLRHSDDPPGLGTYREQMRRPMDPAVGAVLVGWLSALGPA